MFPFNLHKCSFYIFQKKFFGNLIVLFKNKIYNKGENRNEKNKQLSFN